MLPGKLGVGLPVAIPRQAVLGRQWGCLWMGSGSLLPGFPRPHSNSHLRTVFWGGGGGMDGDGDRGWGAQLPAMLLFGRAEHPPRPCSCEQHGGGGGTGGDRAALLLPALLGQRWGRACKYPSLMRGVCAPAADLGVLFFPATGGETHAMAPGRLHRDKPLRQAPRLASGGGTAAIAALCMVVPPHLGSSCLQHPPHLGSSCPRCRGDPRNCSSHLSLKSQEGDAQQMLVGAFPATQHWETPPHPPPPSSLSPSKGHCRNDG